MRRTATAAEKRRALLCGRRGTVRYRYRAYRSNISGDLLEEIPGEGSGIGFVEGAQVRLSNHADSTWELRLPVKRRSTLDVFKDYIRVFVEVRDGSTWQRFPMGLYFFEEPKGALRPTYSDWDLVGRSPERVLALSSAYLGYRVNAGTGALAAARTILTNQFGIPADRIRFPPTDVTLATPLFFDPLEASHEAVWLRIVNALLAAGGFYALFCDAEGYFRTAVIEDFSRAAADVVYDGRWVVGIEDREPEVFEEFDDERFANRVVVRSTDSNQTPPPVGVAENRDPNSRGSIPRLGRVVEKQVRFKTIASSAIAGALAKAELKKASAITRRLSFATLPDPERGPKEAYGIALSHPKSGEPLVDGVWEALSWTLPLDLSGMVHEVSETVAL